MAEEALRRRVCFVVMPFGNRERNPDKHELWSQLYFDHIKPTIERAAGDLSCIRADEILRPGSIIRDIIGRLATADVVIAEMTDQNPNVFYELGVRHALAGNTILLAQSATDIPFDLKDSRTIIYQFTPRGVRYLESQLRAFLDAMLETRDELDNPVQTYLAQHRGDRDAAPGSQLRADPPNLLAEVEQIKRQNYDLQKTIAELKEVVLGPTDRRYRGVRVDLSGTWVDEGFGGTVKYADYLEDHLVFAYEGPWPGVMFGTVGVDIFRFSWSRFDRSMGGKGYLKINEAQDQLEGGIWFDQRDVESMLGQDLLPERHRLVRKAILLDEKGVEILGRARQFLHNYNLLQTPETNLRRTPS